MDRHLVSWHGVYFLSCTPPSVANLLFYRVTSHQQSWRPSRFNRHLAKTVETIWLPRYERRNTWMKMVELTFVLWISWWVEVLRVFSYHVQYWLSGSLLCKSPYLSRQVTFSCITFESHEAVAELLLAGCRGQRKIYKSRCDAKTKGCPKSNMVIELVGQVTLGKWG